MSKFNPPERARLVGNNPHPGYEKYMGQVVTVTGLCPKWDCFDYNVRADDGNEFAAKEYALQKLLPDSDSYQKSTWQDYHDAIPEKVT